MKFSKWLFLLLTFSVLALMAPAALAQDVTYGLSQEDFAAFTAALANSSSQSDFTFSYSGSFDTVTGEGTSSATFAGEGAVSGGGLQVTMSGDLTDPTAGAQPYSTELRFVGNALYIDFGGMWISASETDITTLSEQFGPMLGAGSTDMTDPSALMTQPGMMEAMTALQDIDPESFTSIARSDEGGLAVYTTTVDLGTLMANEGIQQLFIMGAQQGAAAAGGDTLSPEQLAQLPMMFANSTVTITHRVNASTNLVEGFSLNLALPIDLSAMGEAQDPLDVNITLDVTIGGYGSATEIAVPEAATPVSEFLGMMMGGMGS
jgi:hypothetical protein